MKALSKTVSALPVSTALTIDLRAKALAAKGADIISFCVGEPDFDTPAPICRAGIDAIRAGETKYTNASGTQALREAVSASLYSDYGLLYAPSEIVITTGAKYAVYAAMRALLNPGDEVILPAPYWTSYYHIVALAGGVPVTVPCAKESGWKLTAEQLHNAITERTKALILNNPNNPTGAVYTRAELMALAEVCRQHDLYIVADEIYGRLVYTDEKFCSFAAIDDDTRERTVTVNGVSKAFAMTGFRIGYAAGNDAIIRTMSALLSHTTGSPNTMAQAAAVEALYSSGEDTEKMRRAFLNRRNTLLDELARVRNISYTVPDGAFYTLLDVRTLLGRAYADETALALAFLDEEGVATVPCAGFGAPGHLRLSYTIGENRIVEGVQRLRRFIEGMGEQ